MFDTSIREQGLGLATKGANGVLIEGDGRGRFVGSISSGGGIRESLGHHIAIG